MDIIKGYIYSEEDFEEIQKNFNGKAEFDNGSIFLTSSTSIEHNRIKRKILAKLDSFFNGSKCEPFDEQIEVIFQNKDERKNRKEIISILKRKGYRIEIIEPSHYYEWGGIQISW